MSFQLVAKKIVEKIPYSIGQWTSHIPFRFRLGSDYSKFCTSIQIYENASPDKRYKYIIEQLDSIVKYAQANIPFYQNLYGKTSIAIKSLKDFENLPVIKKSQAREYTKECSGAMLLNTGGSPFADYLSQLGHDVYVIDPSLRDGVNLILDKDKSLFRNLQSFIYQSTIKDSYCRRYSTHPENF